MFRRIRYFLADVAHWLRTHLVRLPPRPGRRFGIGLGVIVVAAALGVGGYFAYTELIEDDEEPAAAPEAVINRVEADDGDAEQLGFPEFATKNTTRVAGGDPVADAAAVALASFPSTGGLEGPPAVTLVDVGDWPEAIAASSLSAAPVSAPVLFSQAGELPDLTTSAIAALGPDGSADTQDRQLFRIGDVPRVEGLRSLDAEGGNPAEVAAAVERIRARVTGSKPAHLLIATSDDPAFAMPAAAWAARSGDPILFAQTDSVPEATLRAIRRNEDVPVFVLGPEEAISRNAFEEIEDAAGRATRIAADDPVENAIEFARFGDGSFGWNINDPGHGFVIASSERPADAGAASALSGRGTWGPLLVTDDSAELPGPLRGYLLDLKPGYEDDPTRAVYNHVWLIGDQSAISVDVQAQVDELAEVAEVRSGSGGDVLGPLPGTTEPETRGEGQGGR